MVVNLTNNLPEASSIVFPGQDTQVTATGGSPGLLTTEAAASGGTVSYTSRPASPGTYLYESGSNVSKQVEMGLYGALVVRPSIGRRTSPTTAATQFDPAREFLLLLPRSTLICITRSRRAPRTTSTSSHNRYFTINGRAFPDTVQDNGTSLLPTQPYGALVRIQPNNAVQPAAGADPDAQRGRGEPSVPPARQPHAGRSRRTAGCSSTAPARVLRGPSTSARRSAPARPRTTCCAGTTGTDSSATSFNDNWNPTTNPFPVAAPNYRNVIFKDANTWYSGNPYLGYKGTLPTGTNSLNICGEWYFPLHSHALNEFANFDEGFGGMGTLLRVDPAGGCFTFPTSTTLVGGALKSGSVTALAVDDAHLLPGQPEDDDADIGDDRRADDDHRCVGYGFPGLGRATTSGSTTRSCRSRPGRERRPGRCRGASSARRAATHANGATISALANDWYAAFTGVVAGSKNLKVTYKGKNCATTTRTTCTAIAAHLPQQTVKICNWTIGGAAGCATATVGGLGDPPAAGPAQPQAVGSTDVSSTWTLPGSAAAYSARARTPARFGCWCTRSAGRRRRPTPFSTWGNFMRLVYDAP